MRRRQFAVSLNPIYQPYYKTKRSTKLQIGTINIHAHSNVLQAFLCPKFVPGVSNKIFFSPIMSNKISALMSNGVPYIQSLLNRKKFYKYRKGCVYNLCFLSKLKMFGHISTIFSPYFSL